MEIKRFSIFAIAISMAFVSCSVKSEPAVTESEIQSVLEIRGNVLDPLDADTKTSIAESGSIFTSSWVDGNQIRVDVDNLSSKKTATYDAGSGLFTCSISGLAEGSHTVNAAYPSSTGTSSGRYSFTVPTSQTMPSVNAFDQTADFLVAKTQNMEVDGSGAISTVDMDFRRAVAIVKIIPVDGTTDPAKDLSGLSIKTITITYGADLKTKIKVTPGTEDDTVETNARTFSVSYAGDDFKFSSSKLGTEGAYITFAPGQFSASKSLKFDIETNDPAYAISKTIASLPADITFGANELRPITVTFTDACVELVSTDPEITANNVSIEGADDSGSINFTVSNLVVGGNVTAEVITGATVSNLSLGAVSFNSSTGAGSVAFTCDANTDTVNPKTATVRLTYTYNDPEQTVTKDVEITQAKALAAGAKVFYYYYTTSLTNTEDKFTPSAAPGITFDGTTGNCGVTAFEIDGKACTKGLKLNSGAYLEFTTSEDVTASVTFYYACRKSGDNDNAAIKITPTSPAGSATVFDGFNTFGTISFQTVNLDANTTYRIERQNKELALVYVALTETPTL